MRLFLHRGKALAPADAVAGVFVAQRELLKSLRTQVLAGSGLTAELAELMLELFLAREGPSATEHADAGGCISFRDLLGALGYSPALLSRRVAWLAGRRWVETKRVAPDIANGIHGNGQKVRLTEAGRSQFRPVWRRYQLYCDDVLRGVSVSDLAAHHRVNHLISHPFRTPPPLAEPAHRPRAPKAPVVAPPPALKSHLVQLEQGFLD